jgi:hypothetical protein
VKVVKNVLLGLQATRLKGNIQQHLKHQNQCIVVTMPHLMAIQHAEQLHPSTDIITKWNVQCKKKKEKRTVIMKGNQTKRHFVGPSRGFESHPKKMDSVL